MNTFNKVTGIYVSWKDCDSEVAEMDYYQVGDWLDQQFFHGHITEYFSAKRI